MLFILSEGRILFGISRLGELAASIRRKIVEEQITVGRVNHFLAIACTSAAALRAPFPTAASSPAACGRRRKPSLFLRKLAQSAAVAIDDVGVHRMVDGIARLLPGEVDALVVAGPPNAGGFVSIETGTAHDVVDGERERRGRGNLVLLRKRRSTALE